MEIHRIARHEFACSALPLETFRVVRFEGVEAISQPYRFEVELVSDDPEVAFEDVIDAPATLTMYRGDDPSEVGGIVVDFEQSHEAGGQSEFRYAYRAVLVPRLWRLGLSFQSRIFQNLTVEEIAGQILDEAGVDHEFNLAAAYDPREYTTQYKETDLAFVQRLLEYEGIRYHFRHEGGAETLVLSDDAGDAPGIAGDATVGYSHADGLRPTDSLETIRDFLARQRLVTARTRIKDYNYRTPETELLSESEHGQTPALGVHSDSAIHTMDGARGDRLAAVRAEEIETTRRTMTGTGDCLRFRSGHRFTLADHYRDGLNQDYLLVEVRHLGTQPDASESHGATESADDEAPPGYSNAFTCVPAETPYRPPRVTPEPKLPGVLTARVESAGGTYAPVDEQGRYRVRFPFDLGDAGEAQATKPVRLAQPYTGPGYGHHFPVHKDVEMVVACVDGNVDRILGISTVYNPTQASPVTSDNPSDNVFRSWGQNELTFRDEQGSEEVYLKATKNHTVSVANNQSVSVGNDRSQSVGHDETLTVGNDQAATVGQDQVVTVGRNRMETVGGTHTETIEGDTEITVSAGNLVHDVAAGTAEYHVLGDVTERYDAAQDTAVMLDVNLTSVSGGIYTRALHGIEQESVAGHIRLTALTEIVLQAGASRLSLAADGTITLSGKKVVIIGSDEVKASGKTVDVTGQTEAKVGVGTQVVTLNNQKVSVSGAGITSAAIGVHEVTGAMVKIN